MSDILVIGGGIAGISAAARLSALGRVTLLEAEDALGYHASGRSAALFEQTYGRPATLVLNRASRDEHETRDGGVLSPRGLLLLGNAASADAFAADMKAMALTPLSPAEAVAMVPILRPEALAGAGYHAEAWDIDTHRLIQSYARETRANGGRVVTGARVTDIGRSATGWRVETTAGDFAAHLLVNAAGAWADRIAHLAGVRPMRLTPLRRSMARIPAPGDRDIAGWPMLLGAGETWYARPDAGKLLVSPADEDPQEPHDAWADDMVLAEGIARYEAHVTEPVTRVETSWAGLRTFTPDRCLAIGFAPDDAGFFWVAGHGGCGFQTAPAASRLAADLVAGRAPDLDPATVAALSPRRFCAA